MWDWPAVKWNDVQASHSIELAISSRSYIHLQQQCPDSSLGFCFTRNYITVVVRFFLDGGIAAVWPCSRIITLGGRFFLGAHVSMQVIKPLL